MLEIIYKFQIINTNLKWHIIPVDNVNYSTGTSFYKYNGIGEKSVKVEAIINQALPANGEYPINAIPKRLKPDIQIQYNVITTLGNSCSVIIKTDGYLYLKPSVNLETMDSIYAEFFDFVI